MVSSHTCLLLGGDIARGRAGVAICAFGAACRGVHDLAGAGRVAAGPRVAAAALPVVRLYGVVAGTGMIGQTVGTAGIAAIGR